MTDLFATWCRTCPTLINDTISASFRNHITFFIRCFYKVSTSGSAIWGKSLTIKAYFNQTGGATSINANCISIVTFFIRIFNLRISAEIASWRVRSWAIPALVNLAGRWTPIVWSNVQIITLFPLVKPSVSTAESARFIFNLITWHTSCANSLLS